MQAQFLAGSGLDAYRAVHTGARMSNHGTAMCRVAVTTGADVYAKAGAMVAYEGFLRYEPVPQSFRRALGEWAKAQGGPEAIAKLAKSPPDARSVDAQVEAAGGD